MAYYNKIGLLILDSDHTKFLVCQKYAQNVTADYIMPGGKNDEDDDLECLRNEIKQELNCKIDFNTLKYIGTYEDMAAGRPERTVEIKLYQGSIIGEPKASEEVEFLTWIGKEALDDDHVSPIIRNKILPDLLARGIIKN